LLIERESNASNQQSEINDQQYNMNKYLKIFLSGFLIWLIPFVVSILIFPFHQSNRPLFESIMPVTVTLCVVVFAVLYFKTVSTNFVREGAVIGVAWLVISLAIDLPLFLLESPMKMSLPDYIADIGLTYLIMPTITVGMGWVLKQKQ
jgi:hypothetical protein